MLSLNKPAFGLQKINHRYSTSNNWKGGKLSTESMNKTMNLKLKKVNQARSARSHMELYFNQQDINEDEFNQRPLFKSNSRVVRRNPSLKKQTISNNFLYIDSRTKQKQQPKTERGSPFYYSPNLGQKMNMYLNSLINKSQEDRLNKLKQIELKAIEEEPIRKPSYNSQNLFWRKMKRFISQRKQSKPQFMEKNSIPIGSNRGIHIYK